MLRSKIRQDHPLALGPVGVAPRLAFGAVTEDAVDLAVPIPQDKASGTSMTLTIYWSGTPAAATKVAWAIDAVSVQVGGQVNGATTLGGPAGSSPPAVSTNALQTSTLSLDPVPSADAGDVLFLRVFRDADNPGDDNTSNANAPRDLGRLHRQALDRPATISPPMAKVCHSCGKGPAFGNSRSHSMVATRRRFNPNLQKVRIDDRGTRAASTSVRAA